MSRRNPPRGTPKSGTGRTGKRVPRSLAGRYQLVRRVGVGGMADVYLANDSQLGREVAIKILHPQYAGDDSFVERFRREALAAAKLQQTNIVQIYDSGREGDFNFIVMEYIDGRSLKDHLAASGPLEVSEAVRIARDVLAALAYAHRNGLVHRDVKPGNILLSEDGKVHVTDFGIARALSGSTMTQTGTILGTAYYLSPEQAQGLELDGRSDIYSLGIVLYEMLTGQRPFEGDSPVTIAYKHVRDMARPPSNHRDDIPRPLEAIVMTSMAKRPEDRYSSAALMRRDLEAFTQGKEVTATLKIADPQDSTQVIHKVGPIQRQATRRPGWLIALALALLAGGLALGTWSLVTLLSDAVGRVEVPAILEQTPDQANRTLRAQGLEPNFQETEPSDTVEQGRVTRQEPSAGRSVARGSQVRFWLSSGLARVEVPSVVDLTVAQARAVLERERLAVGEQRPVHSDRPEGTVISQNPGAGRQAQVGDTVDLEVSGGEQTNPVPDVIGLSEADATANLANAGFQVSRVREPHPTVSQGNVSGQDPPAGEEAPIGSVVTITISQGPDSFAMPLVINETEADARAELQSRGLGVRVQRQFVANPNQRGRVISQSPSAGTTVNRGDTVDITVGADQ